jgi:hypothetical protein
VDCGVDGLLLQATPSGASSWLFREVIGDIGESVWTTEDTAEELGEILSCGDTEARKLLVSKRLNTRDYRFTSPVRLG